MKLFTDVKSSYKRSSVPTISTPSFAYNRERINSTGNFHFKSNMAEFFVWIFNYIIFFKWKSIKLFVNINVNFFYQQKMIFLFFQHNFNVKIYAYFCVNFIFWNTIDIIIAFTTVFFNFNFIADALPFKQPTAPSTTSTYRSVYTREPFATYTPRLTATPSSSSSSSPFRPSPTPVQKSTSLSSVQPPLSASSSGSSSSKTVFFPTTPSTISSKSVLLPNPAYVDKTLKVKVVKCTKACDEGDSKVPMYKTSKKNRGRVLVINNVKFLDEKHYREGAEIDERNIVELFKQMGMKVVLYR